MTSPVVLGPRSDPGERAALPPNPGDRIVALDLLRGLALLGMFIVHFHVRSTDPGGFDDVIRTLIWRLVETKSHGTFALLFGAGFAIQLRRAEARGQPFTARYLRRVAVLALFGVAAHVLFGYNVLLGYAIWALPLLLIRSWSTRTLLATAALSSASVILFQLLMSGYLRYTAGPEGVDAAIRARQEARVAVTAALEAAQEKGAYGDVLIARLQHLSWFQRQPFSIMPGPTLALFIAGLLLIRHRVFESASGHRRLLIGLAALGVLSWLANNWLLPALEIESFGLVRDQWLTFTYVAGALLLFARRPLLADRLRPIANAGRLALTNYLLQIAALDLVFSGHGFGLGAIRPLVAFPAALAAFAVEAAFSTLWLQYYRFGPAEWLWRSLTDGRRHALRRAPVAVSSPVV